MGVGVGGVKGGFRGGRLEGWELGWGMGLWGGLDTAPGLTPSVDGARLLDGLRQHTERVVQRALGLVQDLLSGPAQDDGAGLTWGGHEGGSALPSAKPSLSATVS